MDFDLTKEQKIIQKAAREFAKGEFTDVARDLDINETYPEKIVKKARELDLIGLFIPEAYGGPGLGYLEQAMVLGGVLESGSGHRAATQLDYIWCRRVDPFRHRGAKKEMAAAPV